MVKVWAFRPRRYLSQRQNQFDFFIVMLSYLGLAYGADINPSILRLLRMFRLVRVLRTFRILRALSGLQTIVQVHLSLFYLCS